MAELTRKMELLGKAWHEWPRGKGVGSPQIRWTVSGPKGAVTVGIITGWNLPESYEAWEKHGIEPKHRPAYTSTAVCTHIPFQAEEWMTETECDVLPGGKCWGDCGFLAANEMIETLLRYGEDALWKELESWYKDLPEQKRLKRKPE